MLLNGIKVGIAITGSFCTFETILVEIERLVNEGADVYPIMSYNANDFDTRFGLAEEWKEKIIKVTGKEIIATIQDAEPIGPKGYLDILVIAPCTGNTIAKLANAITDTPVSMAWKAHLRNNKPVVVAISTNDGLSGNAKNLGILLDKKNVYFVPFGQDDPSKKANSLIAHYDKIVPTIIEALQGKQIQPLLV
ncbi:dipicolinate synthase subunit B [Tissierella praeacuta DSM 18095]|uniref:Dipicolinate synthase subunit B n=1 Tax=Tissierella praeacuta DSM 18095 TaxID=1123404 RepID=A0A1M4V4K4_9FIRM|nr:dipicolinate synthase subunit B [Tissierella praeacuta]TCU74071.1 dipicolinate synthase subunit B [Tissierella praeacuta]SHE63840.1 dipicolinate synthase subunit B [Tissierella praeacuta DSM 18095]SUP02889.1 dipicolinate synthase subunit B [Tissierella praeacuta]